MTNDTPQHLDERAILRPAERPAFVDVRGASGRLYGRFDPALMLLEIKRKGEPPELIDLKVFLPQR